MGMEDLSLTKQTKVHIPTVTISKARLVQLSNGTLKLMTRNGSGGVKYDIFDDEGGLDDFLAKT